MVDPIRRIVDFKIDSPILLLHCGEVNLDNSLAIGTTLCPCGIIPGEYDSEFRYTEYTPDKTTYENIIYGYTAIDACPYYHDGLNCYPIPAYSETLVFTLGGKSGFGNSISMSGSKGFLQWSHGDHFNVAANEDLTLDFWVKSPDFFITLSDLSTYQRGRFFFEHHYINDAHPESSSYIKIKAYSDIGDTSNAYLAAYIYHEGSELSVVGATPITPGVWSHVAFVKTTNHHRLFLNGVYQGEISVTHNFHGTSGYGRITGSPADIIYDGPSESPTLYQQYIGYDEVRMVKRALWEGDSSFTPPSSPYGA